MQENKKYYWIKLKTDFFSLDEIDFLLSQKNGCEYVVLYQMLCLNTANSNGKLQKELGEIIIPYDVEKIVRDTKYFDFDTVTVALELYKKLGLVYVDDNGYLAITDYKNLVGSETKWAEQKRAYRERLKNSEVKELPMDNDKDNLKDNVRQENRDKSIEIRDKSIDIDNSAEAQQPPKKAKHKYGEYSHVLLTDEEHQKLVIKYGGKITDDCIKYLDEYIEMKGYKAKNHYLCILKWVYDAVNKHAPRSENRAF